MDHRRNFIKGMALLGLAGTVLPTKLMALSPGFNDHEAERSAEEGVNFIFQGDSITDGNRGRSDWDLNHIMGHGYACNIAGRLAADFPGRHYKFINRGVSGNKITDLADRWQKDALDLNPDVLSILVGINDSASYLKDKSTGVSVKQYEETYRELLKQTRAKFPKVLFVLGEPFTLPFSSSRQEQTERQHDVAERSAVVKKLAMEFNAVFVPFQQMFDKALQRAPEKYWIWDQVHPTVAGHELMAREWIKQVQKSKYHNFQHNY